MQISSSYVTTFAPPRPAATLVAVVAADTEGSVTLCQYVDLMDHGSRAFATLDGLIQALQGGVYFDMLLVTLPADVDMTRLLAIRRFSEAPTLFVLPREQLHMLLPVGEALSDLEGIDFVLAPIDPRELKSRLRLLALRGAPFRPQGDLTWGDYRFCVGNRVAFFRDSPVQLKPREFDLALESVPEHGAADDARALVQRVVGACRARTRAPWTFARRMCAESWGCRPRTT